MSEVNTAFPYRPGYVRAERAGDYEPSPVTARAITADGSVVAQAHAAIRAGAKVLHDDRRAVMQVDGHLGDARARNEASREL